MPHSTHTAPAAILAKPLDDPDAGDRLLRDWLNWSGDFFTLAAEHGLTLDQLIAWFRSDSTQHRLSELAALADARAFLLAKLHRAAAITRLTEVVEDTRASTVRDRIRAASQLLRTAKQADDHTKAAAQDAPAPVPRALVPRALVPRVSGSSAGPCSPDPTDSSQNLTPEGGAEPLVGGSSPPVHQHHSPKSADQDAVALPPHQPAKRSKNSPSDRRILHEGPPANASAQAHLNGRAA